MLPSGCLALVYLTKNRFYEEKFRFTRKNFVYFEEFAFSSVFIAATVLRGLSGYKGRVNGELPVVHEERFALVRFEKGYRFVAHAVFDALLRVLLFEVLESPRSDKTSGWSRAVPVRNVDIETVFIGRIGYRSEMPLSEMDRCVAFRPIALCEGFVFRIETGDRLICSELFVLRGGF